MPSWLCISALVHRKAFIRAALRAEDLQAIRLALDLGCERPDFIKQKTLSQARCCAGISHQMSHCHDEAELVSEDVCGLVTKRPKEFLKLSVQQQCLPSEAQKDPGTSQPEGPGRGLSLCGNKIPETTGQRYGDPSRHPAAGNGSCFQIRWLLCLLVLSYCNPLTFSGSFI